MMRVLVCGGRDFKGLEAKTVVYEVLDEYFGDLQKEGAMVIQGGASGADEMAEQWCTSRSVNCLTVPAKWYKHQKAGGPIRNLEMLNCYNPDLVLAFPGGKGTAHMVKIAIQNQCPVREISEW